MKVDVKTGQLAQARGLLSAVNAFLAIRERMPVRCVQAFLVVALHPGESVKDLARISGLNANTMSRNLLDIGARDRWGGKGCGLIYSRDNRQNVRERAYYLTAQGEALLNKVLGSISPG